MTQTNIDTEQAVLTNVLATLPNATPTTDAETDRLLEELELSVDEAVETPVEEPVEEPVDDMFDEMEMIERLVESDIERINEAASVVDATIGEPDLTVTTPTTTTTPRKSRVKSSRPRSVSVASLPDSLFQLNDNGSIEKNLVLMMRPKQKKIGEKYDNLFVSMMQGVPPSVYTIEALRYFNTTNNGTMRGLVEHYKSVKYSAGTAASQAGQLMKLFTTLEVVLMNGKGGYMLNPTSTIARQLQKFL